MYKKHNFNPLSGCLVVFIQMPIFIGLYRVLMVDVELRAAPLISEAVRWCSNLSAPDMLFCWKPWMPDWFNAGVGMFALGPYFNLLPLLTVVLMIWQQKVLTPPPTDEQAIMMQKMMKYMMVFMGLMFFKVASGLCIYIVISSLWSMVERRFLPKAATAPVAAVVALGQGSDGSHHRAQIANFATRQGVGWVERSEPHQHRRKFRGGARCARPTLRLCIYIVISSLWSMVERRFLPKAATAPVAAVARARARK